LVRTLKNSQKEIFEVRGPEGPPAPPKGEVRGPEGPPAPPKGEVRGPEGPPAPPKGEVRGTPHGVPP